MKDFSKQISAIFASNLKSGLLPPEEVSRILSLPCISKAANEINAMLQDEVWGLEMQIVSLTEELAETDALLIEAKKSILPYFSSGKAKSGVRVRINQPVNK